jgi:CRISPR-associated protein (TIGR02584 family)
MKTLLLAVSGMSPAVITETLYGMNKKGESWPAAIKVITTAIGAAKMVEALIAEGHLERLCDELGRPRIPFTELDVLVVPGKDGQPVADARSMEDHEALANFIVTTVRDYTKDSGVRIHASIAGGRKTMTFYLGYAMSLFGRRFDSLSHVLVSEGYENHPAFFFPTRDQQILELRGGGSLDAREAEITLADIPFIRQRHLVPDLLKEFQDTVNFRALVELINLGEDAESIRMEVSVRRRRIRITSLREPLLSVDVTISNPWHWALYVLLIEDSVSENIERGGYARPKSTGADSTLAASMALKLAELYGVNLSGTSLTSLLDELSSIDELWTKHPNLERSLMAVRDRKGINGDLFSTYINTLQRELAVKLPSNLVLQVSPGQAFDQDGELLPVTGKIKNRGAGYGIPLPNAQKQITLLDE